MTEQDDAFVKWWYSGDVPSCTNPATVPLDYKEIARAAWNGGAQAQHGALLEALDDLAKRADRARGILTGHGRVDAWHMLDTEDARAAIAAAQEGG